MKIRLMNPATVRQLLPMDRCIPLMRQALASVARNESVQPIRHGLRPTDVRGLLGIMPGYTRTPSWLGLKAITVFEPVPGAHHGSHQGLVLLFDTRTGAPRAIVDASEITAVRTAAASAVATDVLAPANASSIGIFGDGEQAKRHLQAIALVRPIKQALVWGIDSERARQFASARSEELGIPVRAVSEPRAVAEAEILCTVTAAREPFLKGEWLRPGQHVNLVGASLPDAAEADIEVVRRSRFFGDYTESTRAQAGEWRRAREAGVVDDEHLLGTIGDVIESIVPARRSPLDITVFKSLGMIAEDLIAADHVLREAERLDAGAEIDWQ
jgi:ornithine cyclodeaminase